MSDNKKQEQGGKQGAGRTEGARAADRAGEAGGREGEVRRVTSHDHQGPALPPGSRPRPPARAQAEHTARARRAA